MDDTPRRVADSGAQADPDTARRTHEIREEIERTREDMSETIDAIQDKLRPRNIVAGATERVKSATTERLKNMAHTAGETADDMMWQTRDTAGGLWDSVRQNPIPAAMIGIGTAWLLTKGSQSRSRQWYYDDVRGGRYGYRDQDDRYRGTGVASRERQAAGETEGVASRAREYAGDTTRAVRRTGRRAQNQLQWMMQENPLLVSAGALMIGAAVGMALPETERENEWMGEARDNVMDRAEDMARNAASTVKEAAGDAAGDVVSRVVSSSKPQ